MSYECANFIAQSIDGKHDVKQIKKRLDCLHGVSSVTVNPLTQFIRVDYNSAGTSYDRIENCLNKMGCEITADDSNIHTQ